MCSLDGDFSDLIVVEIRHCLDLLDQVLVSDISLHLSLCHRLIFLDRAVEAVGLELGDQLELDELMVSLLHDLVVVLLLVTEITLHFAFVHESGDLSVENVCYSLLLVGHALSVSHFDVLDEIDLELLCVHAAGCVLILQDQHLQDVRDVIKGVNHRQDLLGRVYPEVEVDRVCDLVHLKAEHVSQVLLVLEHCSELVVLV